MMDEYISREAAKMAACKLCEWYGSKFCSDNKCDNHPIDEVSAADVKPVVKGEWKPLDKIFFCSQCEKCYPYRTNFCPNCGADMRKGE